MNWHLCHGSKLCDPAPNSGWSFLEANGLLGGLLVLFQERRLRVWSRNTLKIAPGFVSWLEKPLTTSCWLMIISFLELFSSLIRYWMMLLQFQVWCNHARASCSFQSKHLSSVRLLWHLWISCRHYLQFKMIDLQVRCSGEWLQCWPLKKFHIMDINSSSNVSWSCLSKSHLYLSPISILWSALIPNSFQETRHILCSNPNAIQQLIIRTSMFSSIKERDWEFFSLATSAYHSFMGNSSCLPSHSSLLHEAQSWWVVILGWDPG